MMLNGEPIGVIAVGRREAGRFTDTQQELLRIFSDQAAIAVQNAGLFDELQTRNDALTDTVAQQTATAEVLREILRSSLDSSADVERVFTTILASAARLCDATFSTVYQVQGDRIHLVAHYHLSPEGLAEFQRVFPMPLGSAGIVARAIATVTPVHLPDVLNTPGLPDFARRIAEAADYRCALVVPNRSRSPRCSPTSPARRGRSPRRTATRSPSTARRTPASSARTRRGCGRRC
ncbi:MAG: GAF domain-containing protein [Candidatus Rokubacteria bacterium]|nr:GAF domain-containing protein [Candidatus Rokubacteria bacterium]